MAQNKILNVEPQYVAGSAGNLLNCALGSVSGPVGFTMTQPYLVVYHVRIHNTDSAAHTVTFYKGATGGSSGGTQVFFANYSLSAGGFQDWVGRMRLDSGDFITGVCDTGSKVTVTFDCEIGVS